MPSAHEVKRLKDLVDKWVCLHRGGENKDHLQTKIDVLERALEILRFELKHRENKLPLDRFIQGELFVDGGALHYAFAEKLENLGSGTAPIRLQPNLLMFLMLYHRHAYSVYDIIGNFVERIRPDLGILDFKKTKTGVTRCFTNTRFAANVLRDYGFLKFTQREAYKTWVLSLPGFLVASKVFEEKTWDIPGILPNDWPFDLHPAILSAHEGLETYDQFVVRLATVCEPDVLVFMSFKKVLQEAYALLQEYWRMINREDLSRPERRRRSLALAKQIEDAPQIEAFYQEFSMCLKIEDLIKSVKAAEGGSKPVLE